MQQFPQLRCCSVGMVTVPLTSKWYLLQLHALTEYIRTAREVQKTCLCCTAALGHMPLGSVAGL